MAALIATGLGVGASILSPGLALDLLSLWPGVIPAAVATVWITIRKGWRRRAGALPSLLLLTWLALGVAAHLDGWPPLPSSAAELHGPSPVESDVRLAIELDGLVEVSAGNDDLYQIEFIRRGGGVGIPVAEEVTLGEALTVTITDSGTTTWFQYQGWQTSLSSVPRWILTLSASEFEADLRSLRLASVSLEGNGELVLGQTDVAVPVNLLSGTMEVVLPPGTAARVVGVAEVPPGWVEADDGMQSPTAGAGWVIEVSQGASVRIVEP